MVSRISSDDFARLFSQRSRQLAWLLGAGASASANVPTAFDMVADFKTRLYCAHTNIPRGEVDASDPLWVSKIETHFDGSNGLPPVGDPREYAAAFETVFPDARDRRSYIEDAVRQGTPSFGHRVLSALLTTGEVRCILTTNFDQLVERSTVATDELVPAEMRAHLNVGALNSADVAVRCVREQAWPLLVKLHGDYQSEHLKNTSDELQDQDQQLRGAAVEALGRFGLVVVGYSGRDNSVMDALVEVLNTEGALPGGLWWVTRPGECLFPRVTDVLDCAEAAGVEAQLVESENFDELAGDIDREVRLDGPLRDYVDNVRPDPLVLPVALPTLRASNFPVLRCSALEILGLPSEARSVTVDAPLTAVEARNLIRNTNVWVTTATEGHHIKAFGSDSDISKAFESVGPQLGETVVLSPDDSIDRGLLYEALVRAIARRRPVRPMMRSGGHQLVVSRPAVERTDDSAIRAREELDELSHAYGAQLTGLVPRIERPFAEALRVKLERWAGRWFLVYEPFTWVDLPRRPDGEPDHSHAVNVGEHQAIVDAAGDWRRERWAQRYNPQWNSIIAAWAKLIAPSEETELATHRFTGPGINARFRVSWTTAWSAPGHAHDESDQ